MKKLTIILTLLVSLILVLPAWAIEKEKKTVPSSTQEQKAPTVEMEKKKAEAPKEIAPPKEEEQPVAREPKQLPEEKKVEKPVTTETEKIKLPPLERKLIDQIDRFVDKNGNGIDDRLDGKERQAEKPKPVEKKKKRD
jgi:hypothetical protein